jgi:hypothetical protein
VFKNGLLRRIFGPKREKVMGGWKELHNNDFHNLYSSPNIKMIKSRQIRLAEHVAESLKERDQLVDLGVDGRIILNFI